MNTYYILYRTNVKYCTSNSENLFLLQSQSFNNKVLKLSRNFFRKSQPQTKINIWKLKQNTISVSHSFISTFSLLKSFQQKPFSKFLPGDYLLSLCFVRRPLTRFHVIVKNMRSFIKLCLVSNSIICINISTFMNSLQSKEKFKQNTCKATNIVSSIVYHHFNNSMIFCQENFSINV